MSTLKTAIAIATKAHKGLLDRFGVPYIDHLTRVMNLGTTNNEKIVGILHDIVEDTSWTFKKLEKQGFSKRIIDALICISKTSEEEDYQEYINRVASNPLALKVKLNDLTDNMDIRRMDKVKTADVAILNRYLKAYQQLSRLVKA